MLDATDRRIAAIASRQHAVITRRQLLDLGLTKREIDYRIQIGRLHRLHRGVYAVGHRPVSPYAHTLAAVLACGPGAVLSHSSAATLWGITRHWSRPLEVTARSDRQRPGLRTHRSKTLSRCDITEHYGIPVTSPARTLLDNADRLTDLALGRAANDLRRARYLNLADLAELLNRHSPTKASKRLRGQLAHPERAPTRSELEDAFQIFADGRGLPEFLVNTQVACHEADIYFPAHKLVVELDSHEYHGGRHQFELDRDRDADLLAAEIATVRITWERMNLGPEREANRLRTILAKREPGA